MTALNPTMRVGRPGRRGDADPPHPAATGDPRRAAPSSCSTRSACPTPPRPRRAYPHQLSGGQRQRVVLAIALANDPALLICDEPTTALDVTVQARVLDLIVRGVAGRATSALLFITHDLAVVATVCERVLVMYGGRIVEAGPVAGGVHAGPRHRYTQGLLAASDLESVDGAAGWRRSPVRSRRPGEFPDGCVFRNRCTSRHRRLRARPRLDRYRGARLRLPPSSRQPRRRRRRQRDRHRGHQLHRSAVASRPVTRTARRALRPAATIPGGAAMTAQQAAVRLTDVVRDYRRPRTSLRQPAPAVHALRGVSFEVAAGRAVRHRRRVRLRQVDAAAAARRAGPADLGRGRRRRHRHRRTARAAAAASCATSCRWCSRTR